MKKNQNSALWRTLFILTCKSIFLGICFICGCGKAEAETQALMIPLEEEQLESKEQSETYGQLPSHEDESVIQATTAEEISPVIQVYVCGAVQNSGVYELIAGARMNEALLAAGGLNEDAAEWFLNLATVLTDGEKVYVPTTEEIENQKTDGSHVLTLIEDQKETTDQTSGLININTATSEQLQTIPGIGEAKAKSIIAYRETKGAFMTPEDIMNVVGIKEGMYLKMKDYIIVR